MHVKLNLHCKTWCCELHFATLMGSHSRLLFYHYTTAYVTKVEPISAWVDNQIMHVLVLTVAVGLSAANFICCAKLV